MDELAAYGIKKLQTLRIVLLDTRGYERSVIAKRQGDNFAVGPRNTGEPRPRLQIPQLKLLASHSQGGPGGVDGKRSVDTKRDCSLALALHRAGIEQVDLPKLVYPKPRRLRMIGQCSGKVSVSHLACRGAFRNAPGRNGYAAGKNLVALRADDERVHAGERISLGDYCP